MFNKWGFLLTLISLNMMGIELNFSVDKKVKVTPDDVSAMKSFLRENYNFIVEEEGAKKLVRENRILANEYLKGDYLKNSFDKSLLKIEIEKKLADRFVRHLQREIKIPLKVLKSYYYDHLEDFKVPQKVKVVRYSFNNFENALKFYQSKRKNKNISPRDFNGKVYNSGKEIEIDKIREPLKGLILQNKEDYLITPPLVWNPQRFDIYEVKKLSSSSNKYRKFEEVRDEIEKILYRKTFNKKREEILSRYLGKE